MWALNGTGSGFLRRGLKFPLSAHGRGRSRSDDVRSRDERIDQLSLSRLDHWLPRPQANPEVMQRTADFHHQVADAALPKPDPIFDDPATLDTTVDVLNPKTALVQ